MVSQLLPLPLLESLRSVVLTPASVFQLLSKQQLLHIWHILLLRQDLIVREFRVTALFGPEF